VPRAIARAYYEAMTPPRGPTFVSVPVDDWDAPAEEVLARKIATLNPGDPQALAALAAAITGSTRPAFVLGAGVARDGAWDAMIQLAQQQRAAVFTAPFACRNVFPESHPLFQGFLPAHRETLVSMLTGFDLVVCFGGPLNLYHTEGSGPHIPAGTQFWHVSDHPGQLAWAPAGNAVLANTRSATEQLLGLTKPNRRADPALRAAPASPNPQVLDDRLVMEAICALLPPDAIVVEEAPSSRGAMQTYLQLERPDSFYTTASGGLGYALPSAVGVALGSPGRRVVAIIGDGSAMYAIQGLFAAHQLRSPITFIIINNRSYQALQSFGHVFGLKEVVGTDLAGLDFCLIAKGHGIPGVRVTKPQDLADALSRAFAADGPCLVEVMTS
jgi:benzoylformate decarboxylase